MGKLIAWMRVIRTKFFLAGIPPFILGASIAWYESKSLNLPLFLLTFGGIILAMAGSYTFNEYFDFMVDVKIQNEDITPFNSGSRVLPEGLVKPKNVFIAGIIFWVIATIIGLYIIYLKGLFVFYLSILGIFSGVFYTAPPIRLAYRGLGEFFIGISFGILITLGSYYVLTTSYSLMSNVIYISIVPALLITAVIWINEFPDYTNDRECGKFNLVARMGRERARYVYHALITIPYIIVLFGVILGIIPFLSIISFITIPLAYKSIKIVKDYYSDPRKLIPAMANTVIIHTLMSILLATAYIIAGTITL